MIITQHTIETPYMVGPVHCYSTQINGEVILFDTGPPTRRAREYLESELDLSRLRHVFITHCHIDHWGLASWLQERTHARIYLPYRDGLKILSHGERLEGMYTLLEELGFDGEYLQELHSTLSAGKIFPPFPRTFDVVEDDLPPNLGISCFSCPGHSQSDLVYFTEEWAITGDVLLRGVFQSPLLDVDLETGERFDNYGAYCRTLLKLATLRKKKIFPGHRKSVDGVDTTVLFYISKMLDRAGQLGKYRDLPDVAAIISKMFRGMAADPFLMYLKASEVVFLLDFLNDPQKFKEVLQTIGLFDEVEESYVRVLTTGEKK